MSHSRNRRLGWQSENLARFILYQFSFIAEPSKIADDIGIDFICTFFEEHKKKHDSDLRPKSSFAIQIKSNKKKFSIKKWIRFLAGLEMPFFVGVIDRRKMELTLYSGDYLTHFFVMEGLENRETRISHDVWLDLCDDRHSFDQWAGWYHRSSDGKIHLKFPRIAVIKAGMDHEELKREVSRLEDVYKVIRKNIVAVMNNRFLLDVYDHPWPRVYIGLGSAEHFEENFINDLAEVFWNLMMLHGYEQYAVKMETLFSEYSEVYFAVQRMYKRDKSLENGLNKLNYAFQEAKKVFGC
ncbi:MAG: hypothetical protein HY741_12700 [Chloroflexi bacterium]|nr:hypothetical protein [Chloroflexota bacterium]